MGQDWKTLSVVVVGAAIAGWWMVRALGGKAPEPVAQPVAVASAPAPAETAARLTVVATPTAKPAPPPSSADVPAALDEEAEVALIQRDLELLQQALVKDQRIEDRVMPRVNDVVDVPGVVTYRRAPDFWEPALAVAKEEKP